MISYHFHPEAEAELEDAALFYESRMAGLGKSFTAEVERTILLIRHFLMQAHQLDPNVDGSLLIGFHIQLCTGEIPMPLLLLPLHINDDVQVTGDTESSTLTTHSTGRGKQHRAS